MKQETERYSGSAITLADSTNISFVLSFPVADESADIINYLLDNDPETISMDSHQLGIYKTMIETWEAGERFLSGIYMDFVHSAESDEEIISVKLIVSGPNGVVDGVTDINLTHAVILAALERKEIIISDRLVKKLIPEEFGEDDFIEDDEDDDFDGDFPYDGGDPKILNIAKDIINGKIK